MSNATNPRWRATLYIVALTLVSWSCEQATAPILADGVFVLRTVGAIPIPAVTSVRFGTEYSVLADTVTLRADGSGKWTPTTARRDLSTGASDTTRTVMQFAHMRRGATVLATGITCEPICSVSLNELAFQYDDRWLTLGSGPSAQIYERIAPSTAR